jgi:hypothetical protein
MDHIATANDSKEIEIHSKWLDWTWTLRQLFQHPENEKVTEAIDQLPTKISCKFDTEILINELETMTKEAKANTFDHWKFRTPRSYDWRSNHQLTPAFLLLENVSELWK